MLWDKKKEGQRKQMGSVARGDFKNKSPREFKVLLSEVFSTMSLVCSFMHPAGSGYIGHEGSLLCSRNTSKLPELD